MICAFHKGITLWIDAVIGFSTTAKNFLIDGIRCEKVGLRPENIGIPNKKYGGSRIPFIYFPWCKNELAQRLLYHVDRNCVSMNPAVLRQDFVKGESLDGNGKRLYHGRRPYRRGKIRRFAEKRTGPYHGRTGHSGSGTARRCKQGMDR